MAERADLRLGGTGARRRLACCVAVALATAAASPRVAEACDITCSPATECTCSGSGACTITTAQSLAAGAVVDCSGRDVVVGGGAGSIVVTDGFVTILADDLTVNAQRSIRAERSGSDPFGVRIELSGTLDVAGWVGAKSNGGGGGIEIETAGDVLVSAGSLGGDGLNANGTASGAAGGMIRVHAGGSITIDDPITAEAAATGSALGGTILIDAAEDLTADAEINALGRQKEGGRIVLRAGDAIDLGAQVLAEGHGVDADGGSVSLEATVVTVDASISVQGGVGATGGQSRGGSARIVADTGGVALNADINATSGASGAGVDGGAIVVESIGSIAVDDSVALLSRSENAGGDGGDVVLTSGGALAIGEATIDARGHYAGSNEGHGARVILDACNLTIAAGAEIDARGYDGGEILLRGRETLTVSDQADLTAEEQGGASGRIALRYRVEGSCANHTTLGCNPIGCATGACAYPLTERVCTTDNDCTECPTGACTAGNPAIGAGTQFEPAAELLADLNLAGCD